MMDFQYTYFNESAVKQIKEPSLIEGIRRPSYTLASISIFEAKRKSKKKFMNSPQKLSSPLTTRKEAMHSKNYGQHVIQSPQKNNTFCKTNCLINTEESQKLLRNFNLNIDMRQAQNHFVSKYNISHIKNVMNSSVPQRRIPSVCKVQRFFGSNMRDYHSIDLRQNNMYSWPSEVKIEPSTELHSKMYGISPSPPMLAIGVRNKKFGCANMDKSNFIRREHDSYCMSSPSMISAINHFYPFAPQRDSFYSYFDQRQQKFKTNPYSQNIKHDLMNHSAQNEINFNLINKRCTKSTFKKRSYLKRKYSENEKRIRRPQKRFSLKISLKPIDTEKSKSSSNKSESDVEVINGNQSDMDMLFPRSKDGNIPLTTNVPRKVEALHPDTKKRICVYASCSEASRQLGINRTRISRSKFL